MILVTGGTGFVGRSLVKSLVEQEREITCLVRSSSQPVPFLHGALRVVTGSLQDVPGLRVALQGTHTIVHLAGAHRNQGDSTIDWINRQGTANLVEAAVAVGAKRIIYLSHMHADRNSAYPLLRGKGAAEEAIRSSGLNYTILKSSLIFGYGDSFTTILAMLIKAIPVVFPVPSTGKSRFQPIHVDDVADCLIRCLDTRDLDRTVLPIGGPQHLSYEEILDAVMAAMRVRRWRVHMRMPWMRALVGISRVVFPNPPISDAQLDLFAIDNTTDLGNVPRNFDFEPRRFTHSLGYLGRKGWRRTFLRYTFRGAR